MSTEQQLQQAFLLWQQKRFAEAQSACLAVLGRSPLNADGLHLLGLTRKQLGDAIEAERYIRQSIQLQPARAEFHANLGNLLRTQRRLQEARASYERALSLDARHANARLGLARLLPEIGEHSAAEEHCRVLIQRNGSDSEAWSALAGALRAQGKVSEAEAAYRAATKLRPDYAAAHHNLGALLAEANRAEEALTELDRARALGINSRELALNRGHALLKLYRLAEAEGAYAEAVALAPLDIDAQRSLAQLRFMLGDAKFARDLVAACAAHPQALALQMLLAETVRNAGDLASAEVLLRDLIARSQPIPALHSALAGVLMEAGRLNEAREHAKRAQELSPEHPAIIENLIGVELQLGEARAAFEAIQAQRLRDPLEQRWLAYEALAARLLGNPRYTELYDYDRLVRTYEVAPPKGWSSIEEFNVALDEVLGSRHLFNRHPLELSLRHGSQTSRSLLVEQDPLIRAALEAFNEPLADYASSVGNAQSHPVSARNRGQPVIDKCWSVRLRQEGFHVNHIHPEGWISSAYYVSVPPETLDVQAMNGWIKFGEPKWPVPGCSPERHLQPRSGRLVLFPSYMWHGTTAIHGLAPRTTIAFDAVPSGER